MQDTTKVRNLREIGHLYFDLIVRYKAYYTRGSIRRWRSRRYKWLSKRLKISREDCHFRVMTEQQLVDTINILSLEFANNEKMIDFAEQWESGKLKFQTPILSKNNPHNANHHYKSR